MSAWVFCAFVALVFFVSMNAYFGWNALPKSDAEVIADGIVFLMLCLTAVCYQVEHSTPKVNVTVVNK